MMLGANYTVREIREKLSELRAESAKQSPYFDARLLDRIEKLESALLEDNDNA